MKHNNIFWSILAIIMMTMLGMGFVACGDDDDDELTGGNVNIPSDDNRQTILSESEQKKKIEDVAREFINKIDANDFQDVVDVVQYASEQYTDEYRYDCDELDDWFENALKACELKSSSDVVKRLYVASNFTGKFETGSRGWEYKGKSSNLEFTFKDKKGNACKLVITASGDYTAIHNDDFDEYEWEYHSGYGYEKVLIGENTIGIPAKVTATLSRSGSTLAKVEVTTDISGISGDITLSKGVYAASMTATAGGYTLIVEKANFNPQSSAYASVKLKKGSEVLISATAQANGRLKETTHKDKYDEWKEVELVDGGECSARIDVLGSKLSVRGTIVDLKKLVDSLNDADDNYNNESAFKESLRDANEQLNFGIYYDGGNTRMASLKLLADVYRWSGYYSSYEEWEAVPGILFTDGTSYIFDDFFDEKTFRKVIDAFEDLIEDFERLAD